MTTKATRARNGAPRSLRSQAALSILIAAALAGCSSFEDYVYPSPDVPTLPEDAALAPDGVALGYLPDFAPLPVVAVELAGRDARALIATRHGWHAIAPAAVPPESPVVGTATVPIETPDGLGPEERDVVQVERIGLAGAELGGLHLVVEPLPAGVDLLLTPAAFRDAVVTFDGPARELRIRPGRLPKPREAERDTLHLSLDLLMGPAAAQAARFWASIEVVAATELDGSLLVGTSTSTVIEVHRGPELLPLGVGALQERIVGEREVRMDNVFGRDRERQSAQEVEGLGSGWLVLGAGFLAERVLELDPSRRLARLGPRL